MSPIGNGRHRLRGRVAHLFVFLFLAALLLAVTSCSKPPARQGDGGPVANCPDAGRRSGGSCTTRTFPAGVNPGFVAIADVNGDCHPDIVVTDVNANAASVLVGHGDGTFDAPASYPAGTFPAAVAIADFNGDGWPDLAVANSGSNDVTVLIGAGGGAFRKLGSYPVGADPRNVVAADVNSDGHVDLVVLDANEYGAGTTGVSVLLGNGDGTFRSQIGAPTSYARRGVAVSDLNHDGHPDVAVGAASAIYVLLGVGDGTLQSSATTATAGLALGVAVADFNGDGNADLAAALTGNPQGEILSILLGRGDGTFPTHAEFGTGSSGGAVVLADVNGDGILDVAVLNTSPPVVSVFLGAANATVGAQKDFSVAATASSLAVGDLNEDGVPDFVTNDSSGGNVTVLLGPCY